jgi:hypothetical protein
MTNLNGVQYALSYFAFVQNSHQQKEVVAETFIK